MYKISIIIPIYNAGEYLEDCIKSLKTQTIGFESLEIIMVDDCSTDNSQDIMKRYEEQFSNIRCLYLNKNSGSGGRPRNKALEVATADYVMFLDADDEYYNDACRVMFEKIQDMKLDCVSGYYSTIEKGLILEENALSGKQIEEKIYHVPNALNAVMDFQSHFACKIYKREVIVSNAINFPEGIISEDVVFFWRYVCNIHNIYYIPVPILKYRQRRTGNKSVSYILTQKYFEDTLQSLKLIKQCFAEKGYVNEIKYALKNTNDYFVSQLINSGLPRDGVFDLLNRWTKAKYEWTDSENCDVYLRIVMSDIDIGNVMGAADKVILLRELKKYNSEVFDAKNYCENQYNNIETQYFELKSYCEKLQQGKDWIENQYNKIKSEFEKLKIWCEELQHGKDWIEKEWKNKCEECEELKEQLNSKRKIK